MKDYTCKKFLRPRVPIGEAVTMGGIVMLVALLGLVMLGFISGNDARVLAELSR